MADPTTNAATSRPLETTHSPARNRVPVHAQVKVGQQEGIYERVRGRLHATKSNADLAGVRMRRGRLCRRHSLTPKKASHSLMDSPAVRARLAGPCPALGCLAGLMVLGAGAVGGEVTHPSPSSSACSASDFTPREGAAGARALRLRRKGEGAAAPAAPAGAVTGSVLTGLGVAAAALEWGRACAAPARAAAAVAAAAAAAVVRRDWVDLEGDARREVERAREAGPWGAGAGAGEDAADVRARRLALLAEEGADVGASCSPPAAAVAAGASAAGAAGASAALLESSPTTHLATSVAGK
jgi:hypothetical protein